MPPLPKLSNTNNQEFARNRALFVRFIQPKIAVPASTPSMIADQATHPPIHFFPLWNPQMALQRMFH